MRRTRPEVVRTLERALGPYIGEAMVRASVNGHWDKLGLDASADEAGLARLLEALAPGLNVFVGRSKGEALMASVSTALRGETPRGAP